MSNAEVTKKDEDAKLSESQVLFNEALINGTSNLDDIQSLNDLIKVQEKLDSVIEERLYDAIDKNFATMLSIIDLNNFSLSEYFQIAEERYEKAHGVKPSTLRHADISFTETGKRRRIKIKYKGFNEDSIWAGRGKMPTWMIEDIKKFNLKQEDFFVDENGNRTKKMEKLIAKHSPSTDNEDVVTA